jgi:hypothetical protein
MNTRDLKHYVQTFRDGNRYRAECPCGWTSEWFGYDEEAEWAAEDHREVVTDTEPAVEPEGFDRFMSGLLDLQDDLVAASLWLVEHWTADLPVPGWSANGADYDVNRPAFRVTAYCRESADLIQAAELLGVEVLEDPAPDTRGNRYQRATRRFGRVEVEAFTAVTATCTECGAEFSGAHCPGCYDPPESTRSQFLANDLAPAQSGAS